MSVDITNEHLDRDISAIDIEYVMKSLRNRKASGSDGIAGELIKYTRKNDRAEYCVQSSLTRVCYYVESRTSTCQNLHHRSHLRHTFWATG